MIELQHVSKTFHSRTADVCALEDISLSIRDGEIFGIIGLSGAGKSTLVRCINRLEKPTAGRVLIDGEDVTAMKTARLLRLRRNVGMIFQNFNLLEQRNVLDNITFPLEIAGVPRADAVARARELLAVVGLAEKEFVYPSQLSGGQKQRVAIARALATSPKYLLCDEATSALDPNTTAAILELLQHINREMGVTMVVITHEMDVIDRICHRVAVLDKSHVVEMGNVSDVFTNPQSQIARELILSKMHRTVRTFSGPHLRLVFNGENSYEPLISKLVTECGVAVNILFADMKQIEGRAFGQMLIELPKEEANANRAMNWLTGKGIPYTLENPERR